jgi:L-lysine exporter family protein LysE/ArgO
MSFYPALYGGILTLGIIMPLGAQNLFVFNQGLQQPHFRNTWPSILTATFCDGLLIVSAILGISLTIFKILWLKYSLVGLGGVFLCYLSYSLWFKAVDVSAEAKATSWFKQIVFTLSVSLLNPQALLDTFLIIGSNALLFSEPNTQFYFGLGCITTELMWFSFLSYAGNRLRRFPNQNKIMIIINKMAAVLILGIAMSMFYHFSKF